MAGLRGPGVLELAVLRRHERDCDHRFDPRFRKAPTESESLRGPTQPGALCLQSWTWSWLRILLALLGLLRILHFRCVDETATALELAHRSSSSTGKKRFWSVGKRRNLVRIQRGRTSRGVISTISSLRSARTELLLKRWPMIGSFASPGDLTGEVLRQVVQQSGHRERLPVSKLHVRLRPSR